ncbi:MULTISPECIES: DUF3106 domain-containing protein [Xanthomonas]|uniref:DUF3106 domain-containing protein n=1 Tax=Xanthomonas phaseoli pv. dieffenbachiae TaxID=92828 RepID=A0A1V9H858_9XANT|nr:DUF3106 domain-containing protein [Xanthomonas phaseoli]MBO9768742.1 DUF3106 domain-containing protein [Xanthomonas phaseoli pv. dieffenbachiae]MBO9776941.1 DUF3106 domain-containing protein [Xanthomonas phaseoli pv. dieffenbachiae]MBO9781830.1 DUF3106 domain-containing protein [Xanthomonas phaseoli pv. dieffenbachiae]MBO9787380.1 DUF3106 domain-containing protein [Xanthomonas phaseoli pv. dieffenbachiae]MBO9797453.1 DUF3106 domain-containing protein [Xanthomonas phaseoli pv. dieffenbachiae
MMKPTEWCGLLLCAFAGVAGAQRLPTPLEESAAAPAASTSAAAAPNTAPSAAQQRARWAAMTPAQQAELRARYAAWKGLTATDRVVLRQARERLQALPEDQQRALRTQFGAMDRLHRDGWRLGSQVGAFYAQLQPLIGYVHPNQREAMLAALRSLDAGQLEQLAVLAQRTPPQERDGLREAFLAEAPATRSAWLKRQLAR